MVVSLAAIMVVEHGVAEGTRLTLSFLYAAALLHLAISVSLGFQMRAYSLGIRELASLVYAAAFAAIAFYLGWPGLLFVTLLSVVGGLVGGTIMGVAQRLRRPRENMLRPEDEVEVRSDDQRITATYPDGVVQSVRWDQIDRVIIETDASGPWGADLWWVFEGAGLRCAYPNGATGEQEALESLRQHLVGFSDAAVGEAMRTTTNARFLCWERGPS